MSKNMIFIINSSRKLNKSAALTLELAKNEISFDCTFLYTQGPKQAINLAKSAADDGFTVIVAVGGDGTCNEVVNGIQLSKNKKDVIFGIIPNGTGNDFHKMIGAFDPHAFIEKLKSGQSKAIDLIQLNTVESTSYALNIAGMGFDGHVVNTLESFRKTIRLKGKFAYALAIIKSFITFKKAQVKIKSDQVNYSGKMLMVAICNGKVFGHGLYIHPAAEIDSGKLGITLLGDVSFLDYVKNLGKLKRGELIDHPEVQYFETTYLSVEVLDRQLFTEMDGESVGYGNWTFSVISGGLKLLSNDGNLI